jgi:hypothetical protein
MDYQELYEKTEEKQMREDMDRLTAVSHIQVEHFSKHQKMDGYYEYADAGHLFTCDRLWKMENMFGRIQMGYNPNRGRSFLYANIKTSRYDTASSLVQRELKEYQMHSLLKGENENRAYISRRRSNAAVLLEKAENKPWTEYSVQPYLGRVNTETLMKVMPFLNRAKEKAKLQKVRQEQKELQLKEAENSRKGDYESNVDIRRQLLRNLRKSDQLQAFLYRKDMNSRLFFRKINYAMDIQKHEMFEYYKERRLARFHQMEQEPSGTDEEDEN